MTSIGVNPLETDEPVWVTGPDVVGSWLLTRQWPEVLEAIRLVPEGKQEDLKPVMLGGTLEIDLRWDDFFERLLKHGDNTKPAAISPARSETEWTAF